MMLGLGLRGITAGRLLDTGPCVGGGPINTPGPLGSGNQNWVLVIRVQLQLETWLIRLRNKEVRSNWSRGVVKFVLHKRSDHGISLIT